MILNLLMLYNYLWNLFAFYITYFSNPILILILLIYALKVAKKSATIFFNWASDASLIVPSLAMV